MPQISNKPLISAAEGPTKLTNDCGLISHMAPKQIVIYKRVEMKNRDKWSSIIGTYLRSAG